MLTSSSLTKRSHQSIIWWHFNTRSMLPYDEKDLPMFKSNLRSVAADCNCSPQPRKKGSENALQAAESSLSWVWAEQRERLVQADGRHQLHEQSVAKWGRQKCQTRVQKCRRSRTLGASLSAENRDTNMLLSYRKISDNSRRCHSRSRLCS